MGVSSQAQTLYDTLSKTLPCRWQGTSIVVLGEVCPSADALIGKTSLSFCFLG